MDPNQPAQPPKPPDRATVCPSCGAAFSGERRDCWLCGWKADDPLDPANRREFKWTFSLGSVLLWVALAGVLMGLIKVAPVAGIAAAILFVPAGLNTVGIVAYRQYKSGRTMTASEKIGAFAVSVAAFVFIAITVLMALVCSLLVGETSGMSGVGAGALVLVAFGGAAGVIAYKVLRSIWQRMS